MPPLHTYEVTHTIKCKVRALTPAEAITEAETLIDLPQSHLVHVTDVNVHQS